MIAKEGVRVHLDPTGDRVGDADFKFTGWIAADEPITEVRLPAAESARLTTCDRPDVQRAFPGMKTLGFSGKCAAAQLARDGLLLALQVGKRRLEVHHPVPSPLPEIPFLERTIGALQLAWLRLHERWAPIPSNRFAWTLQRHLLARELRSGVFQRRHTDALLADFATAVPDALFLQIGANDGFTGDPLNPLIRRADTRWRGILVEPVAHLFAKLLDRYGDQPALQLERAAIGETDGTAVIHRLQTAPADSLWLEQIPSLDPVLLQQNAAQFGRRTDTATVAEEVPSLSVATLLKRYALTQLDLLVIDAEGWDWRILRQFDLETLRPKLILYEHQHLTKEECEQAHLHLDRHNYGYAATHEGDTLAWNLSLPR